MPADMVLLAFEPQEGAGKIMKASRRNNSPEPVAAIEIGSTGIRLLIASIDETGSVNVLDNDTDLDNSGAIGLVDPSTVTVVNGSPGNVGLWIDLAGGGRALIDTDGSVKFDPDGDFDIDAPTSD